MAIGFRWKPRERIVEMHSWAALLPGPVRRVSARGETKLPYVHIFGRRPFTTSLGHLLNFAGDEKAPAR